MHRDPTITNLAPGLHDVLNRIRRAETLADRPAGSVELVAVSKQQPEAAVAAVLAAGQSVFGENRVQEARQRWTHRRSGLMLHLIGPLQTNKAEDAVGFFDVIETLDRPRLASSLASAIQKLGKAPKLLIQVNTGSEPQKSGIDPRDADAFVASCRKEFDLNPIGLMCIPPADEPVGPHFQLLAMIARRNGLEHLSMGMSGDFETAIRFGATSVRVGSAVFGSRQSGSVEDQARGREAG